MLTDYFESGPEDELDIICNVVSILPIKFNQITKGTKEYDDCFSEEIGNHKSICYYVMNNGCVEEEKFVFDRPDEGMKQHLKPFFIWAKIDIVGVNKVLVNRGATIDLMPKLLLRRIVKTNIDLGSHNMVL